MYAAGVAPATLGDAERPKGLSPFGPRASLSEVWSVPWGRCDDTYYRHPKVAELDDGLRKGCNALFWLAVSWANDHLTDGRIPAGTLRTLGADVAEADELVRVGLWETADRGYLIHDWPDFNRTKVQVEADREQRRAAGAVGGRVRWNHGGSPSRSSSGSLSDSPSIPPSEPTSGSDTPIPRTPSPRKETTDRPLTQRQYAHRWLRDHGASAPTGWANGQLNELIKVYTVRRVIAIWEAAPKEVRTSNQFVRYVEHELAPSVNGSKLSGGGHTRKAEEVEDAFG